MMRKLHAFAVYPHFISETLRLDRYSSVLSLNSLAGNFEVFVKKNIRARVIANSFLNGAYQANLTVIEGDEFLLSAIDLRRLMQLASDLDFQLGEAENEVREGISLPKPLWTLMDEAKRLPLSGTSIYHTANLNYLLWQIACFYGNYPVDSKTKYPQKLSWVVSFYATEVKRQFRSNREVNEAHFRLAPSDLLTLSAKVLVVDLPHHLGYRRLPPHLLLREIVTNPNFKTTSALPPETYLGSRFESQEALLGTLNSYLEFCEHIDYWVIIIREQAVLENLITLLNERHRKSTVFSHEIMGKQEFSFVLSQRE